MTVIKPIWTISPTIYHRAIMFLFVVCHLTCPLSEFWRFLVPEGRFGRESFYSVVSIWFTLGTVYLINIYVPGLPMYILYLYLTYLDLVEKGYTIYAVCSVNYKIIFYLCLCQLSIIYKNCFVGVFVRFIGMFAVWMYYSVVLCLWCMLTQICFCVLIIVPLTYHVCLGCPPNFVNITDL